jgi:hypothetical protein
VKTPSVIVPTESTGCHHHTRRKREEATGTRSTRQIEKIPSIISIDGASIIVITLIRQLYSVKNDRLVARFTNNVVVGPFLFPTQQELLESAATAVLASSACLVE